MGLFDAYPAIGFNEVIVMQICKNGRPGAPCLQAGPFVFYKAVHETRVRGFNEVIVSQIKSNSRRSAVSCRLRRELPLIWPRERVKS